MRTEATGMEALLGPEISDVEEESFLLFSQSLPSRDLGMVDLTASTVELTVLGRELVINQSPTLLASNRRDGTTGSVVWGVTPLVAEWIASSDNLLRCHGWFNSDSTVLELGCGVAGVVAIALAPFIRQYIATDQDYVMKLLKSNIAENNTRSLARRTTYLNRKSNSTSSTTASTNHIAAVALDWEKDSLTQLPALLRSLQPDAHTTTPGLDIVIACDCIYNDALIDPFVNTCAEISRLRSDDGLRPTLNIIAQQLRSSEVFEAWLRSFHKLFHVWRVPDQHLTEALQENSGYAVHLGIVR